jgi:hypothetical protein
MAKVRRINLSQVEGNNAYDNDTNEIRPYGEIGVYQGDFNSDIDNSRLELLMFGGTRTHLKSKVLSPGILYGSNADSGDGAGLDTIKLIPDAELYSNTGNDQYVIVDPAAPNHIHLRAGGTIDGSNADLFLGGEKNTVMVSDSSDRVTIKTDNNNGGTNNWQFESNGSLNLPAGGSIVGQPNPETKIYDIVSIALETPFTNPIITVNETLVPPKFYPGMRVDIRNAGDATGAYYIDFQDTSAFRIFTDAALTQAVDASTWAPYTSGGEVWIFADLGNISLVPNISTGLHDYKANGQFINIYPTNDYDVPHIHIAAGRGSTSTGDLILGDDRSHIDVNHGGFIDVKTYNIGTNAYHYWTFGTDGNLQIPAGGDIVDSTGTSVLGGGSGTQGIQGVQGADGSPGGLQGTQGIQGLQGLPGPDGAQGTAGSAGSAGSDGAQGLQGLQGATGAGIGSETNTVGAGVAGTIWTDTSSNNTMAKLMVVGVEVTTGDSQSCEVLITKKSDNTVTQTVYAVIHTSANPIYTLAASWNSGSSRIILDATVPGANNISFTVRSITTETTAGVSSGGTGLGNSDFSDILVVSAQAAGYWTSYSLTGDYAAIFAYQGNTVLSLTNQTVYGHQFAGGDKILFVNDAAINSNHYGLVIEFPSTPQLGDVVSVAVMGDSEVVTAGNFVVGRQYTVKTTGDTNWTSIGGQPNIGWSFTATGVGSGTGTAYAALGVDRRIFKPASGQRIRIMAAGGATASYYIGENETYKGAYIPTIGGQEAQTLLFTYVGVIGGTPTWYQLYF